MLPRTTSIALGLASAWFLLSPVPPGISVRRALAAFVPRFPVRAEPEPVTVKKAAEPVKLPNFVAPAGSLERFYAGLREGRTVRVLHYGDSPTTADSITSGVRRILQKRFGDAGHGFLLIAPPWAWYGHNGVALEASGWKMEIATQSRARDHIHGLGGVSFTGTEGDTSQVTLKSPHAGGRVYYLAQPDGGAFTLSSGDMELMTVETGAEEAAMTNAAFVMPEGATALTLRVTRGSVRLFGYRLDKDRAGVQYSSIGVNGAQVQMILRSFDLKTWQAAMRAEDPDLVILNYGTNESVYPEYADGAYADELRAAIARVRAAVPAAGLLIMSPMDRGVRSDSGVIETPDSLRRVVAVQRKVAQETGAAFYNTFEAMGGAGTMARWYEMQPRLVSGDFIHPLPQGADQVAELFAAALIEGMAAAR